MSSVVVIPLLAQLVVPLALLGWIAAGHPSSRLAWALGIVLGTAWFAVIALAGLWLLLPWYLPLVYAALLAAAAAWSWRRMRREPLWPATTGARVAAVARGALVLGAAWIAAVALGGRSPPGPTVELAPPLRGKGYLVVNGGSTELLNAHLMTLGSEPRFRPWRGQSHGVDIARVGPGGLRALGLPADPARYAIFGDTVYAPCTGQVVAASDSLADQPVPIADRRHMLGNNVMLECGGLWVMLAHLQHGEAFVEEGAQVSAGDAVGRVGNTGNSEEPHLHLHVQRPGTPGAPAAADPLPMRVGGRYLVRNDRLRW